MPGLHVPGLGALGPHVLKLWALSLCAVGSVSQAQTDTAALALTQIQGSVEVQAAGGIWARQTAAVSVSTALRTGTGRAGLRAGERGEIVMGGASQLRRLRDEADLTSGQFLLRGPVAVHVAGLHLVMEGAGQVRVDLSDSVRRVAVLSGTVRMALPGGVVDVGAGQQLALKTGTLSPFQENDPWYASQFRGPGDATIQATRGPVRLSGTPASTARPVSTGSSAAGPFRSALVGDALEPGLVLSTDAGAWAEIGFSGGGYLRLNERSELSVLNVERTSTGREVLLRLQRGTAWNVVEKGQGGYRIDTPVVSTAVRGTTFRVDATGLVKVFEGQVVTPSDGDQPISQGQQRGAGGQVGALQLDATDQFNQTLDTERARPLTLELGQPGSVQPGLGGRALSLPDLALVARSQPGAGVSVTVAGRTVPVSGADGEYRLERLENQLPEGSYRVTIRAQRAGQRLTRTQVIRIDRTAPVLSGLRVERQGRVLSVSGAVRDASPERLRVTVTVGALSSTHFVGGAAGQDFRWLLPNLTPGSPVTVSVRDAAGNETNALLP